jgi:hypothetical protein
MPMETASVGCLGSEYPYIGISAAQKHRWIGWAWSGALFKSVTIKKIPAVDPHVTADPSGKARPVNQPDSSNIFFSCWPSCGASGSSIPGFMIIGPLLGTSFRQFNILAAWLGLIVLGVFILSSSSSALAARSPVSAIFVRCSESRSCWMPLTVEIITEVRTWNHCCPVDGGYYFIITLQDKGF